MYTALTWVKKNICIENWAAPFPFEIILKLISLLEEQLDEKTCFYSANITENNDRLLPIINECVALAVRSRARWRSKTTV